MKFSSTHVGEGMICLNLRPLTFGFSITSELTGPDWGTIIGGGLGGIFTSKDHKVNFFFIAFPFLNLCWIKQTTNYNILQWLLAYHYGQPPSKLGLSNIGLGLYLDG